MRLAFIDIDNTILDFDAYVQNTIEEGFRYFSLIPYEPYICDIFHRENRKLWNRIEEGTLTFHELEKIRWNTVFSALGIEFDGTVFERYFREKLYDSAIPVEGAVQMLQRLRKTYILCAASNGPYEQQMHRIQLAGMEQYFTYFFISEQVGAAKPSREFFDAAFQKIRSVEQTDVSVSDTFMIGDSMTSDIKGGADYGMKTVYFDKRQEGRPDGAYDYYVKSLCEIPGILQQGEEK